MSVLQNQISDFMVEVENTRKVHFGYIAPIEYLDFVPKKAKFHLCLAHLLPNPTYAEFYKKRQEQGDLIFMDNSAFEFGGSIEEDKLLELIAAGGFTPNVIVAPDYPGQKASKTILSTKKFIKTLEREGIKSMVMGVPQSVVGDWKGWLDAFDHMQSLTGVIGLSILGIPNAAQSQTGTKDITYNRLWAMDQIQACDGWTHDGVWYHALGAGSPSEFRMQAERTRNINDHDRVAIHSLDTSSPIWHGILGIKYDDSATGLIKGKSPKHVNFDIKRATGDKFEKQKECILHNIKYVEAALNNKPSPTYVK